MNERSSSSQSQPFRSLITTPKSSQKLLFTCQTAHRAMDSSERNTPQLNKVCHSASRQDQLRTYQLKPNAANKCRQPLFPKRQSPATSRPTPLSKDSLKIDLRLFKKDDSDAKPSQERGESLSERVGRAGEEWGSASVRAGVGMEIEDIILRGPYYQEKEKMQSKGKVIKLKRY